MKPTTGTNEKTQEESATVVPIQTIVPMIPSQMDRPRKWMFVLVVGLLLCFLCMFTMFMVLVPRQRFSHFTDDTEEYELMSPSKSKQYFNVRIDINGERCVESVHADETTNVVTFRYTGENGREAGMAIYDFNQGLIVMKEANGSACFFANAYDLPVIQLADLQLRARNKEVMNVEQKVAMRLSGIIPNGFVETSSGPLFGDLCRDGPSYWMELAESTTSTEVERQRRSSGLTLDISVPAGASVIVVVLDGTATGGTFRIALPKTS